MLLEFEDVFHLLRNDDFKKLSRFLFLNHFVVYMLIKAFIHRLPFDVECFNNTKGSLNNVS